MSTHDLKVDSDHKNLRLDVFLTQNLPDIPSRSFVKKLIDGGYVQVNKGKAKVHHKVHENDCIHVDIPEDFLVPENIEPEDIVLDIFYEDEYLLVINKPSGMLVHPAGGITTGTLVNALLHHCDQLSDVNSRFRAGIVHRLDQDTSGLIIAAKDNRTHTKLAKQFQKHRVIKHYAALVEGNVEFDEGVVDVPLGRHPRQREKRDVLFCDSAKEAITYYRVLKREDNASLVDLMPKTGRTHQLRVHMSYLKHPILGDEKYGRKNNFPRLALHAKSIGFEHPAKKCFMEFSIKTPMEFLKRVKFH